MKITNKLIKKLLSKRFRKDGNYQNPHYLKGKELAWKRNRKKPEVIAYFQSMKKELEMRRKWADEILTVDFREDKPIV